jgi:hypothetical protein
MLEISSLCSTLSSAIVASTILTVVAMEGVSVDVKSSVVGGDVVMGV